MVGDADVFAIQERVIEHILAQSREQRAIEEAPRILDPVQQTVATLLRGYLNHPHVNRQELRRLIRALATPLPHVHVRALKTSSQQFGRDGDIEKLLGALRSLPLDAGAAPRNSNPATPITRENLHLVCYDFVWS